MVIIRKDFPSELYLMREKSEEVMPLRAHIQTNLILKNENGGKKYAKTRTGNTD
jgi:hypothetical protein